MADTTDDVIELGLNQSEFGDFVDTSLLGDSRVDSMNSSSNGVVDYVELVKSLQLSAYQMDELMAEIDGTDESIPNYFSTPKSERKPGVVKPTQPADLIFVVGAQDEGKLRHLSEEEAGSLFSSLESFEAMDCTRAGFLGPQGDDEFQIHFGDFKSMSWFSSNVNKFLHNAVVAQPGAFRNQLTTRKAAKMNTWLLILPGFLRSKSPQTLTQGIMKSSRISGTIEIGSFIAPESLQGLCKLNWKVCPLTDVALSSYNSNVPGKAVLYYGILPIEAIRVK